MKLPSLLLIMILHLGAGCQVTQSLWADARDKSLRANNLEGLVVDASGMPLAAVVRYETAEYGGTRYLRVPIGAGFAPDEGFRLAELEGMPRESAEQAAARLDPQRLRLIAQRRPALHRRAERSRSHRMIRLDLDHEVYLHLDDGQVVAVYGYSSNSEAPANDAPEYYIAVPGVIPRSGAELLAANLRAAMLTPFTLATDAGINTLLFAGIPLYMAGVWEWP